MKATAKPWPNGKGYDVGSAVIELVGDRFVVIVPAAPRIEEREHKAGTRPFEVRRFRMCRVAAATDPIEAVRLCQQRGALFEMFQKGSIPFIGPEARKENHEP